jgi:hypothetical protein
METEIKQAIIYKKFSIEGSLQDKIEFNVLKITEQKQSNEDRADIKLVTEYQLQATFENGVTYDRYDTDDLEDMQEYLLDGYSIKINSCDFG